MPLNLPAQLFRLPRLFLQHLTPLRIDASHRKYIILWRTLRPKITAGSRADIDASWLPYATPIPRFENCRALSWAPVNWSRILNPTHFCGVKSRTRVTSVAPAHFAVWGWVVTQYPWLTAPSTILHAATRCDRSHVVADRFLLSLYGLQRLFCAEIKRLVTAISAP